MHKIDFNAEDYSQRDIMRDFLIKLGIIEPGIFDNMIFEAMKNFGTPNTIIVHPQALQDLMKLNNLKP